MATNDFSKEERVAFEAILEGYNDALVLSQAVRKFPIGTPENAERSNDIIWRPQPYIAQTFNGRDQTGNFYGNTQLSVPATATIEKSSPTQLSSTDLRDQLQSGRLGMAAAQKLASDINISVMNVAANQGTLVVKRTVASSGYDDVAKCDEIMNEQGIAMDERYLALSSRDYNGMASNLAARGTMNQKPTAAYERSSVGMVASFETLKLDYANRLTAAAGGGGLTMDTQAAASNYYTPVAKRTAVTGETSNVDNRRQTVTISSTVNVAAGDCFTIAGVEAVHHITKNSTGNLKTFRVISVESATTMVISPPIISNQGGTDAEAQYQNVEVTEDATAAIVFLNTVTNFVNPFWHGDAIELHPSSHAVPTDGGPAVMKATTDQGIELMMVKWLDGNTLETFFRWDIRYGVTMLQPQMAGIMLFSQT